MENFINTEIISNIFHTRYQVIVTETVFSGCEAVQSGEYKRCNWTACIQLQNISSCSALRIEIRSSETSARITNDYVVSL